MSSEQNKRCPGMVYNPVLRLCLTGMTLKSVGCAGISVALVFQSATLVLFGLTISGRSLITYHVVRQG